MPVAAYQAHDDIAYAFMSILDHLTMLARVQDFCKMTLVLDGYSAPLTAGNFAQRVLQGEFENRPLQVEFASVIANPPLAAPEGVHSAC